MSPFGAALGAPAPTPKTLCNTVFYCSIIKNGSGSSMLQGAFFRCLFGRAPRKNLKPVLNETRPYPYC